MQPKEEEYAALTRKNQKRLYITLLLALIVIILAFIVLKPYKIGDAVDAADKSPAVRIVSQERPGEKNTVKEPGSGVKSAKTPSLATKKARGNAVYALQPLIAAAGIEAHSSSAPRSASRPVKKAASQLSFPGAPAKKTNPAPIAETKNQATIPSASARGNQLFTLQVASLADPIKAAALSARLKKLGFPARVENFTTKGKIYYRVRVGAFSDRDKANQVLARLQRAGFRASIVR